MSSSDPLWSGLRGLRRPARELLRGAAATLFAVDCAACGERDAGESGAVDPHGGESGAVDADAGGLCAQCRRRLLRRVAGCSRCGEPVIPGRGCIADHRPLRNLARVVAPLRYAGTGGVLVRRFKLDGSVAAGLVLGRAMRQAWRAAAIDSPRHQVVSVPLHPSRRRERGFDQADWLAQRIAARWRWPRPAPAALVRVRATRPQGDPLTTSREHNVVGAFAVRDGAAAGLRHKPVLLIDDVFTTGATLRACAAVLRAAGAGPVTALVACRS